MKKYLYILFGLMTIYLVFNIYKLFEYKNVTKNMRYDIYIINNEMKKLANVNQQIIANNGTAEEVNSLKLTLLAIQDQLKQLEDRLNSLK